MAAAMTKEEGRFLALVVAAAVVVLGLMHAGQLRALGRRTCPASDESQGDGRRVSSYPREYRGLGYCDSTAFDQDLSK